jgi:hypothetical protein
MNILSAHLKGLWRRYSVGDSSATGMHTPASSAWLALDGEARVMKIEFNGKLATAAVAAAPLAVIGVLNKYSKRYQATKEENERTYPGDDLLPDCMGAVNRAIDIAAPPEKVWPLLNQIGQTKAGFYSFSIFELMAGFRIFNEYKIQPRWQHTKVGDFVFFGPMGVGMEIALHEPGKYFVGVSDSRNQPKTEGAIGWCPLGFEHYAFTWGFFLEPDGKGGTRLISRNTVSMKMSDQGAWKGKLIGGAWGWSGGVMTTRMLATIKECAEDRRHGPLHGLADCQHKFWNLIWGSKPQQ